MNRDRRGRERVPRVRCAAWDSGQSAVEFALVLPFFFLLIFALLEAGLVGIRSVMATGVAHEAARTSALFEDPEEGGGAVAMLSPSLFRAGRISLDADAPGRVSVEADARALFELTPLRPASRITRGVPWTGALRPGLSDALLRGGDTPSPYCREGEGYRACGYPK